MRTLLLLTLLTAASFAAQAQSAQELIDAATAAQQAVDNENVARNPATPGGPAGPGAKPALDGCIGKGGGMSLLGVQSDMGKQGISPAAKLGPEHPAMKALSAIGTQMGLYADREKPSAAEKASNEAARVRKGQHDYYAEVLGLANWGRSGADRLTELPDVIRGGDLERAAKVYKEYQVLARTYATLYEAARKACP